MTNKETRGRKQKLSRNLLICKLRDQDNMKLKELANMFGTTESNIGHIVERHWTKYIVWKNRDLTK